MKVLETEAGREAQLCREGRNRLNSRAGTSHWSPTWWQTVPTLCPEAIFFISHLLFFLRWSRNFSNFYELSNLTRTSCLGIYQLSLRYTVYSLVSNFFYCTFGNVPLSYHVQDLFWSCFGISSSGAPIIHILNLLYLSSIFVAFSWIFTIFHLFKKYIKTAAD